MAWWFGPLNVVRVWVKAYFDWRKGDKDSLLYAFKVNPPKNPRTQEMIDRDHREMWAAYRDFEARSGRKVVELICRFCAATWVYFLILVGLALMVWLADYLILGPDWPK